MLKRTQTFSFILLLFLLSKVTSGFQVFHGTSLARNTVHKVDEAVEDLLEVPSEKSAFSNKLCRNNAEDHGEKLLSKP